MKNLIWVKIYFDIFFKAMHLIVGNAVIAVQCIINLQHNVHQTVPAAAAVDLRSVTFVPLDSIWFCQPGRANVSRVF